MSKVIEIEETVSRTIQVRQYEPVTITSKIRVTVEDGEDVSKLKHKYIQSLVAVIEADLKRLYPSK